MTKDIKLADLPMRYVVVFYGLYILGRSFTTFIDEEFSRQIFTGEIQHATYGFNFAFIAGTLMHAIVFAYLVVEFGASRIPRWFSMMVVGLHAISIWVAFYWTSEGSLGCVVSEFGAPHLSNCIGQYQHFSIILRSEIVPSIITAVIAFLACLYSLRVISKNKYFFKNQAQDEL